MIMYNIVVYEIDHKCEWLTQLVFSFKNHFFNNLIEFPMRKATQNSISLAF
jgi:hypothetical protein